MGNENREYCKGMIGRKRRIGRIAEKRKRERKGRRKSIV